MHQPRYALVIGRKGSLDMGELGARWQGDFAREGLFLLEARPGIALFGSGGLPLLRDEATVIVGTVFDPMFRTVSDPALLGAVRAEPAVLVQDYWGGFVALVREGGGRAVLLHDAGGLFPCYYVETEDMVLAASDLDLLAVSGTVGRSIAWPVIARHLRAPYLRLGDTAICGVTELEPGHSLTVDARELIDKPLWSPWSFSARDAQFASREEAAGEIRRIATGVVTAWGSGANHVLVELSGGLDSSIVAAALCQGDTPFDCATFATHDRRGDERVQAGTVSGFLGKPLHEGFLAIEQVDLEHPQAYHLPRPLGRAFEQAVDQLMIAAADACDADMFMHGGGGDHVFCYLQSAAPVLDRWFWEGWGKGVWDTLRDISLLAGCSSWATARQAISRRAGARRPYQWQDDRSFLADQGGFDPLPTHPWFLTAGDMVPGKLAHAAFLLRARNATEAVGRSSRAPVIAPLLSQPLVEACLRVPSWWWCEGGQNRVTARRAFETLLPPGTLARRSKGTPDAFVTRLYESRRAQIAAMLLDGELASRGYLDRPAIEQALYREGPVVGTDFSRLLALVDIEAWVRYQLHRAR